MQYCFRIKRMYSNDTTKPAKKKYSTCLYRISLSSSSWWRVRQKKGNKKKKKQNGKDRLRKQSRRISFNAPGPAPTETTETIKLIAKKRKNQKN